jgi:hypothetical protein
MLSPSKGTTASSSLATCKLDFNNNTKPVGRLIGPESIGAASRPVKSFKSIYLYHDNVDKAPGASAPVPSGPKVTGPGGLLLKIRPRPAV